MSAGHGGGGGDSRPPGTRWSESHSQGHDRHGSYEHHSSHQSGYTPGPAEHHPQTDGGISKFLRTVVIAGAALGGVWMVKDTIYNMFDSSRTTEAASPTLPEAGPDAAASQEAPAVGIERVGYRTRLTVPGLQPNQEALVTFISEGSGVRVCEGGQCEVLDQVIERIRATGNTGDFGGVAVVERADAQGVLTFEIPDNIVVRTGDTSETMNIDNVPLDAPSADAVTTGSYFSVSVNMRDANGGEGTVTQFHPITSQITEFTQLNEPSTWMTPQE